MPFSLLLKAPGSRRGLLLSPLAALGAKPDALASLEARAGGRLGVCVLDTRSGRARGHRLDERFAMCSTFKFPLAAVVLREADAGRLKLDEWIPYSQADMISHAPVTSANLAKGGMTAGALAEAAQVTSDNPAANLLLKKLGGPGAFTAKLRELGARATRLDNFEPAMNLVLPGEEHDTTTPRDMALLAARCVTGNALRPASRDKLIQWMIATNTGARRIRAGVPAGWRAGDKTGSAWNEPMTDKINDVAVVWPPGRAPVVIAAYFDSARRSQAIAPEDEAVLAEVGRIALR